MNQAVFFLLALVAFLLAGCGTKAKREEFVAKEALCLQQYCAGSAPSAKATLIEFARYAEKCQKAGVQDINYDVVLARTYGRLFLVERHLGQKIEAGQYLQKYSQHSGAGAVQAGLPEGEMEKLIEQKYDSGLQIRWKPQRTSTDSRPGSP